MIRRLCTYTLRSNLSTKLVNSCRLGVCQYSDDADMEDEYFEKPNTGDEYFEKPNLYPDKMKFGVYEEMEAQKFLQNMDDIMKQRMKRCEFELEELRYTESVPDKMTALNWKVLLTECNSTSKRIKYLKYLWQKEIRNKNDKEKKTKKLPKADLPHMVLDEITYPSRLRLKEVTRYGSYRSLMFGNPLVFDLDFKEMSFREQTNTMDQLLFAYGSNLKHINPFHLHFTGYKGTRFGTQIDSEKLDEIMYASFHEKNFTDVFDLNKIIYLSPDGPVLKKYDPNKIYVIGGFVDLRDRPRETLGKTKALGIECGRLPLDRYVKLKTERDLTLTAMMNIMLNVNLTHNWKEAILEGLPRTKYIPMTEEEAALRHRKKMDRRTKWTDYNQSNRDF